MAEQRRIITRAEWGARYANGWGARPLPIPKRFLHHSVTIAPDTLPPFDDDYAAVRRIEQIGQDRFGKGMSYTALFMPSGLIFEGLGIDRVGSHTADNNTAGAGLCLVGNYEDDQPTKAQLDSVAWWLRFHRDHGYLTDATITAPHSAVYNTACPGQHAEAGIDYINATAQGTRNLDTINEGGDDMYGEPDRNMMRAINGRLEALTRGLDQVPNGPNTGEDVVAFRRLWEETLAGDPLPDGTPFGAKAEKWLVDRARDVETLSARLDAQEELLRAIAAELGVTVPEQRSGSGSAG